MTTTNHNTQPTTQSELTPEERSLYDIAKINELRARQLSVLNDLRASSPNILDGQYVLDFNTSIDDILDDFLAEQGVDSSSANYAELRDMYRSASVDRINENEWGNSPASRGTDSNDHKSQSDIFKDRIVARIGSTVDIDDPDVQLTDQERQARDTEFETLESNVADMRDRLATMAAKRQGKLFTLDRSRYDKLQKEYFATVQALGKRHLQEHADYDEADKNLIAITILFEEQEELRELTKAKLANTKVGKFVSWMNRGNKWMRAGKGVLVGVGAGLAGSFLAGAVGAGIVAGGAVAASRFARGYAFRDKDRGMKVYSDTIDVDVSDIDMHNALTFADDDNRMAKTSELLADQEDFETGTKGEQRKRQKAFAWGAGSIALGAVIGAGIHEGIEHAQGKASTAWDWAKKEGNGGYGTSNRPEGIPSAEDVDGDGIFNGDDPDYNPATDKGLPNASDLNHDGLLQDNERLGDTDALQPDTDTLTWADFSPKAQLVTSGEGWYQTFNEMGIPKEHWADVLNDVGPELQDKGWAYFDQAHSEWRISHTGKLDDGILNLIAESSKQDGYTLAA